MTARDAAGGLVSEEIVRRMYERHAMRDDVRYICQPLMSGGFRCGQCRRGRTKRCAVCKSKITNGL